MAMLLDNMFFSNILILIMFFFSPFKVFGLKLDKVFNVSKSLLYNNMNNLKLNYLYYENKFVNYSFIMWVLVEIVMYMDNVMDLYLFSVNSQVFFPFFLFFYFTVLFMIYFIFNLNNKYLIINKVNKYLDNMFGYGLMLNLIMVLFYFYSLYSSLMNLSLLDFDNVIEFKVWCFYMTLECSLDFYSLIMVSLTLFVYMGVFLSMFSDMELKLKVNNIYSWFLSFFFMSSIVQSMVLFFLVKDLFLMFVFFELSVLPLCMLLAKWGYANKYSAFLFLAAYTMLSSLCFLILVMMNQWLFGLTMTWSWDSTFDYTKLNAFTHFMMTFFVMVSASLKLPVIPFHVWLPEAHVESPTVGSMLLAGVLLKAGVYLLYSFLIMFTVDGESLLRYVDFFMFVGLMSSILSFFMAFSQVDFKWCMAYLSVAHMSVVFSGLLAPCFISKMGCFFMSFSHGMIASILFYFSGFIMYSYGTWSLFDMRGLMDLNPQISLMMGVLFIMNSGMPGTLSFKAEFLMLNGLSFMSLKYAYVMAISMVLNGLLNFYLFSLIIFGNTGYTGFNNYKTSPNISMTNSLNLFFVYIWFCFSIMILMLFGMKEYIMYFHV